MIRIGRTKRGKKKAKEVAYDISSSITIGKRSSRFGGLDFELGNDDDNSDILRETVSNVTTNVFGRLRRFGLSRFRRTSVRRVGRKNFGKRDR